MKLIYRRLASTNVLVPNNLTHCSFRHFLRSRAALTVYDDSDCKVLLLAAIQDNNLRSGTEGSYHRHGGPRAGGLARDHVDVEVFPGEDFQFTADCYVLVLAETKRKAEEVIFYLQVMRTMLCLSQPEFLGVRREYS